MATTERKPSVLIFVPILVLLAAAVMLLPSGASTQAQQTKQTQQGQQPLAPVGSGFTYQGRLKDGGSPANDQYDFIFTLYDALGGGTQVGSPVTVTNQTVTEGLFTVQLDFGSGVFGGEARWLEIAVRPAGGGSYTTLDPRQPLTAVPYAMSLATGTTGAVISGTVEGPALVVSNTAGFSGIGVKGYSPSFWGVYGNSSTSVGVMGISNSHYGVYGSSTSNLGVFGRSVSNTGVYGSGSTGVYGESSSGYGVYGTSNGNVGVYGQSSNVIGVYGRTNSTLYPGVRGWNDGSSSGVEGRSVNGTGVSGTGATYGVRGSTGSTTGVGVSGACDNINCWGVYGVAPYNNGRGVVASALASGGIGLYADGGLFAGWFQGNVEVTGTCCAAGAGTFKIDHPLDPENKFLVQSAVQSADMKSIYDGNVTTNAKGEAVVSLPDYVEALNEDFRYQLTVVGQFAEAIVAEEIRNSRFTIKTDKPNVKVSWQVTGIRKDAYAKAHPLEAESAKSGEEQGKYRHPKEWNQPESKGIGYEERQRMQEAEKEAPKLQEPKP